MALLGLVGIDYGGSKYYQYWHVLGEKVSATLMIDANVSGKVSGGGGGVLEAYSAAPSGDSGL